MGKDWTKVSTDDNVNTSTDAERARLESVLAQLLSSLKSLLAVTTKKAESVGCTDLDKKIAESNKTTTELLEKSPEELMETLGLQSKEAADLARSCMVLQTNGRLLSQAEPNVVIAASKDAKTKAATETNTAKTEAQQTDKKETVETPVATKAP